MTEVLAPSGTPARTGVRILEAETIRTALGSGLERAAEASD
jgi:hypothetical protein